VAVPDARSSIAVENDAVSRLAGAQVIERLVDTTRVE